MLMHRVELHYIEAVMEAQDLAQLQERERNPGAGPRAIGDADSTPNRLLRDAVGGLSPQRRQLGLADNERLLNTVAGMATRARLDGLERIDHVIVSTDGQRAFAVQRSEEHTSELQSLMRISYAVFCLKT